jgi:hypothetical protein
MGALLYIAWKQLEKGQQFSSLPLLQDSPRTSVLRKIRGPLLPVAPAAAVGEKSIEMIKAKELLSLTGYIHGGCSPIGMKKQFVTVIHETAPQFETIFFSAGKIGCQVEMPFVSLQKAVRISPCDII